nr:dna polymerase subunit delta-2 [Quercus suber]
MTVSNVLHNDDLLCGPDASSTIATRSTFARVASLYNPLHNFRLPKGESRHYQQQYADMYFARLAQLKPAVDNIASSAWADFIIAGETARKVDRVLDVRQGELCWVTGTCFMDMPLKPNVLDDLGKEHWIAAPPPRLKYGKGERSGQVMLEDESGRLRLTGGFLRGCLLVTGAIVAVVGTENADGDFEVLDLMVPDLPRQPQRWERDDGDNALNHKKVTQSRPEAGKIAIVSGLGLSGDEGDTLVLDLLMEYLLGESASPADQASAASISRLIIAGNSLSHACPIPTREDIVAAKKMQSNATAGHRKYGYDSSAYNAIPTDRLDILLATLLPSLPITLLPGEHDPTGVQLPQQPIHAAMFPHSRVYSEIPASATNPSWFDSQTNPAEFDVDGFRFLGTGGQTVDDVYKYIAGEARLEMMEAMLRWRLTAPTAPDTLWCYPFQDGDQFVLKECPHVYLAGSQPSFETAVIEGPVGQQVRLIAVPKFRETGELVLLDAESLVPEIVKFELFNE